MNFFGKAQKCTAKGWQLAAAAVGCEEVVLRAVVAVETGGSGFDRSGRPKALFEPHVFYRILSGDARKKAVSAGLAYAKWGTRPYPSDSYPRILAACRIDEERGLQAASWGLPQILGQNHDAAGFRSAAKMVAAFCEGEDEQLLAMARFIVAHKLDEALRRKDWVAFAKGYNGPSYVRLGYHTRLAKAYAQLLEARPVPEVLTPEVKNESRAIHLSQDAKVSGVIVVSTAAAAPTMVGAAMASGANPLATIGVGIGAVFVLSVAGIVAWRALGRVGAFR